MRTQTAIAFSIFSLAAQPAIADDDHSFKRLRAHLVGYEEVPAISTAARGAFRARISEDEQQIEWELAYTDLESDATQAHIHFGQRHVNGGISVFLCSNLGNGPDGTLACPLRSTQPPLTGTIKSTAVIGPGGQGIAAGEFEELLRAIRGGIAYANVHSTQFPTGEIRGQIRRVAHHEQD